MIMSKLKIAEDLARPLEVAFPDDYFESKTSDPYLSFDLTPDGLVLSFFNDENLYHYVDGQFNKVAVNSEFPVTHKELPKNPDMNDVLKYYLETSSFSWIYHHEETGLLYRCYILPEEYDKNIEDLQKRINYPQSFVIQVFDEKLDLQGETLFEDSPYHPFWCIFNKRRYSHSEG